MNGLRVPWAWYIFPFSLSLLPMGIVGSKPVKYQTYIWLTMASYENSKLTAVSGNAPQKIHPLYFPAFDKEMPLTTALKTHQTTQLSTPSCLPPPLALASLTLTPLTPPCAIITTLEPYVPTKLLTSPSFTTQTLPSFSHFYSHSSTTTNHHPLWSSPMEQIHSSPCSCSILKKHFPI